MRSLSNKKAPKVIIIFLASVLVSIKAYAAEISGVTFAEIHHEEGIKLSLQGTGLKTVLFFKAFAAGFYHYNPENLDINDEIAKRIEVEYFVNIPGEKLNNYTIERIKDNVSRGELASIQGKIEQMSQYFVDLKPGDRFSLTYIPGIGTKFAHNGNLTGVVTGEKFAKALFSVWIGERPFDPALKEQILGSSGKDTIDADKLALNTEK